MPNRKTPLLIAALVIAFLCGKYFAESRQATMLELRDPPRVYIEQLKTKMNIRKNREDVEVYLNGKRIVDDTQIEVK